MVRKAKATIEDLYRVPEDRKAEIVNGEEVRSENDYGPAAERQMAAKRADYFAAGTLVVWDVDVLRDRVVRVYRSDDPEHPTEYRSGEMAEAEPALPGWRMAIDDLVPR